MPFCPKCHAEHEPGFETCGTCGVDLVATLEDIPPPMTPERAAEILTDRELVVVVRGDVASCQDVAQALLECQVPAVIATPEDVDPQSAIAMMLEVLVAEEHVNEAARLLHEDWAAMLDRDGLEFPALEQEEQSQEASEEQEQLACPGCGSTEPLQDGQCPECGLFLGG